MERPDADIGNALCEAAGESFESLAFMELAIAEFLPAAADGSGFLRTCIGPGSGGLMELALSDSLLEELIRVLYNLGPGEAGEAMKRNALLEIVIIASPFGGEVDLERRLILGPGAELVLGYARRD